MRWVIANIFCFVFLLSFGQHQGIPFIQNYSNKTYGAKVQNWDIAQTKEGKIIVANSGGTLIYDGKNWIVIPVDNNSAVRSIAIDHNDQVFVGSIGEIGRFNIDEYGGLAYESLNKLIPDSALIFKDVWKSHSNDHGVYFQTFDRVFLYRSGQIETIDPDSTSFHLSFQVGNNIYINERGIGLKKIENNILTSFHATGFFKNLRIYGMAPFDNNVLVATREKGLFLITDNDVIKFENDIDDYLIERAVYDLVKINDTQYALATLNGGIVVMNDAGSLVKIIDETSGLADINVKTLFVDKYANVWAGLNNGLSKMELNSPVSYYSDLNGLSGSIRDVLENNDRIYVATSEGVFVKTDASEMFNNILESPCWELLTDEQNKNIIIASTDGVFIIKSETSEIKRISDQYAFSIAKSNDPNKMWIGLYEGLLELDYNGNDWQEKRLYPSIKEKVRSLKEDDKGLLWLGVPYVGFVKYNPVSDQKELYDTTKGIVDVYYNLVYKINGGVIGGTTKGLVKYNAGTNLFEPYDVFGSQFSDGSVQVFCFEKYDENEFWYRTTGSQYKTMGKIYVSEDSIGFYTDPFERFADDEIFCIEVSEHNVWFGGAEGLYRYNKKNERKYDVPYPVLLSKITVGKDSVVYNGYYNTAVSDSTYSVSIYQDKSFSFPYRLNDISFEFTAPFFDKESELEYSWHLVGNDDHWSDWKKENKNPYTNLHEGDYEFKVKARNIYGKESEIGSFSFSVLPPWYRTTWAYFLYVVLFIGLVYTIIQISLYRLKQQKKELERIVDERTQEIKKQKEEIEHQHEILEEKNIEIMDSINYAQGIQNSILPKKEKIKRYLPHSFVLFRPKDVVSGDFFWMEHKDGISYFTASDCTGHGVPGAFVSMVGANGLHRAVNEYNLIKPAEILDKLAMLVEEAFSERKDGMDIALCSLSKDNILSFAGANNPLWIINPNRTSWPESVAPFKGDIGGAEVKANKQPVGKFEARVPFDNHEIPVKKGDKIYVFSDGYPDQFGGPKGKKFMSKKLKELLISIYDKSMDEQHQILNETIDNWIKDGDTEQIDDICIFGVEII